MNEFCRVLVIGDEVHKQQVVFFVDMVGKDKWGITVTYQGDNGKLMHHHLQPWFDTANAALVEIELNSDGLLKQLM